MGVMGSEMKIRATICTTHDPAAVREPLAAVAAQAAAAGGRAEALLVASGIADIRGHARLADELSARLVEAGPGLSVARNAALDGAGDDDVVAFIDDDAIPHPDWLERLAAAWDAAGAEVACIGGAIVPRWQRDPPAWVSERVWTSFSLLDRGSETFEVSPRDGEDVWGANVSFRAGSVRSVGGFNPARGPWPGFPLFGDESDVEVRLEEAGMKILYAGGVRVEHLIDPERMTLRSLARRERWRGVSAAVSGRRSAAGGLPKALKAAGGTAVAVARGDRALAGERFARTWREAGVAASPLLVRRLRSKGWPG